MLTCACLARREFVFGTLSAVMAAGAAWPFAAGAQAPPAPAVQELARGRTDYAAALGGPAELITLRVTLPAGGVIAWHTHPGPVQGAIVAGELTVYTPDGCTTTYAQGSAVFVSQGTVHEEHNAGALPLEIVAQYLVPEGSPVRVPVDAPEPAACPA